MFSTCLKYGFPPKTKRILNTVTLINYSILEQVKYTNKCSVYLNWIKQVKCVFYCLVKKKTKLMVSDTPLLTKLFKELHYHTIYGSYFLEMKTDVVLNSNLLII